jgi:hypothetical protein
MFALFAALKTAKYGTLDHIQVKRYPKGKLGPLATNIEIMAEKAKKIVYLSLRIKTVQKASRKMTDKSS